MSKKLLDKKTPTIADIAEKNHCSLLMVRQQLAKGIKVEMEHTNDPKIAKEIALDHLGERLDYYKKLAKAEAMKEETTSGDVRGLGYVSGDPAVAVNAYCDSNAMSYEDENGNRFEWIKKQHTDIHNKGLGFKFFDPTEQNHRIKNLKESDYSKELEDPRFVNTVSREARFRDPKSLDAVLNVMHNRMGHKGYGSSPLGVVSQRGQFAAYNKGAAKGITDADRQNIINRAKAIWSGSEKDITGGANEFRTTSNKNRSGGTEIGGNTFYKTGEFAKAKPQSEPTQVASAQPKPQEVTPKAPEPTVTSTATQAVAPKPTQVTSLPGDDASNFVRKQLKIAEGISAGPERDAMGYEIGDLGGGRLVPRKLEVKEEGKDPCWKGYKMYGMKKKSGKKVPNCVPVDETGPVMSRYTERPTYENNSMGQQLPRVGGIERGIYEDFMLKIHNMKEQLSSDEYRGPARSKAEWQASLPPEERIGAPKSAESKWMDDVITGKTKSQNPVHPDSLETQRINDVIKGRVPATPLQNPDQNITKLKEYWTPYLPPHHKHSAHLSKEKAQKPDLIMDPGGKLGHVYKGKKLEEKMAKKDLEEVAMAMPPNVEAPVPSIRRAAPAQQQRMQGSTYRAGQSFSSQGTRVSPNNVRMGSNYGTMKPTSTQVTRNISGNYRAGFGQQATGSMKPTSVGGGMSFSQGGSDVGSKMAASKQTSSIVKGMTSAGREASSVISKAAPTAAKSLGAVARFAGGPAATAAAAVMSPTPAGAGEDEKKRQSTLKDYNPYKSQGRSVSQYEKDVLTPKASEAPTPKVDAPTPPERPQYFSRGQAFSAARGEAGGGEGKFSYDSKTYQTNVKGEPYKPEPQLKQTSIKETKMDTKDLINEAIGNIMDENLHEMKDNFLAALQEKAIEKLEERKKEIAANYFSEE